MMSRSRIIIIILSLIAAIVAYSTITSELLTLKRTEEDLILGIVFWITSWISKFLIAGIIFYSVFRLFKKNQMGFLFPLTISLINLVTILLIKNEFEKREASPIIFQAHYDGDINGITLYLRKNNTYKIDDFAFLGGTSYYGNYNFKADTIILSEKYPLGKDRNFMSNKLLIGPEFVLIKRDSSGHFKEEEYLKLRIKKKTDFIIY